MDIAVGHTAALPFCTSHKGVEVINLGTGRGHSVLELISVFESATGVHIPFQIVGRRAGDIPVCFASAEKAKVLLGWQATRTLSDMCRDAWNYIAKKDYVLAQERSKTGDDALRKSKYAIYGK